MPTLRDLVPELAPIEPEEVLERGRRRSTRRHLVSGLTGAAVLSVAVAVGVQWLPSAGPTARPADTYSASSPTPTPQVSCPQPSRLPGEGWESASYTASVIWKGKYYVRVSGQPTPTGTPGSKLGTVPCNIVEINDRAGKIWTGTWPDGSSTSARVGAPIHEQVGSDPSCELTVRVEDVWALFRAEDC